MADQPRKQPARLGTTDGGAPCTAQIQMRYTDLDPQGHVNNTVLVEYLQQARTQLFRAKAEAGILDDGVVVVSHQIEYASAILFQDEPLLVDMIITELGGARFTVAYQLWEGERFCASARTVLCPFDFAKQVPRRLTAVQRDGLAIWSGHVEPFKPIEAPALNGRGQATLIQPRWSDVDNYGHINNVKHAEYFLVGRMAMMADIDPRTARAGVEGSDEESSWLVARQDIHYLSQMAYRPESYQVNTAVLKVGRTSLTLGAEIVDPVTEAVTTTGQIVVVHGDHDQRPAPLPDDMRERFLAHAIV